MSALNPDGVSVKGCTHIYAPRGQAGEYAPLAANPYHGCGHHCAYCYVPAVKHMTRAEFDSGAVIVAGYADRLRRDAAKYRACGVTAQVMLSFTTDPYPPVIYASEAETDLPVLPELFTRWVLTILQEQGLAVCTLSKGGSRALRDRDLFRPERDAYAATLTSLDARFARKWERAAADPDDRIATLRRFHDAGIFTWVSLEPTLDIEASLAVVRATHGYVDLYKVGRANYLKEITRTTDWRDYTLRMLDLFDRLACRHYVKRDLQPHLPAGYHNPLRVAQHH